MNAGAVTALTFQDLNAFLHFGYLPRPDPRFLQPILQDVAGFRADKRYWERSDERGRCTHGGRLLRAVFGRLVPPEPTLHVVPLSGGFDSRAILGQLLDLGLRDEIVAVTYGVPGALDYQIAQAIAREAGVRHELIDLSLVQVTESDLEFAIRTGGAWTCLVSTFFNRLAYREFGDAALYWPGFLGGPIAGSHYQPAFDRFDWAAAQRAFALKEGNELRTANVLHPDFRPQSLLPGEPYINDCSILNYFEQLDLAVRQTSYIQPTVVGTVPSRAPFAEPEWISFFLSQPPASRRNQALHRRILGQRFPGLFRHPSKQGDSKPARRMVRRTVSHARSAALKLLRGRSRKLRRGLNYVDFEAAYRWRPDFVTIANRATARLTEDQLLPWCDPGGILDLHRRAVDDYSEVLQALVSLHYNLRAGAWQK